MTEILFVVEESEEGGLTARAASESIYTEADTLDELRVAIRDAIECHFDADNRPALVRMHFTRDEMMVL